jgi:integrase
MGGVGNGVEVRNKSIRIKFTLEGKRQSPTLMLNGEPMKPTAPNVRYAHRLAIEIKQKIKHGTFSMAETFPASDSGGTLTVTSQIQGWLDAQRLEQSTLKGYIAAQNFWANAFGTKPLRALKHSDILKATAARPDLSGKTINNYTSVLREALQMAVLDRVLTENPMVNVPQAKWQRLPVDPFTRDEAEKIIEHMRVTYPAAIHNLVEWWFFTGVRTSEMVGLRWPQADMASGEVLIKEAIVRGVEKDNTKTNVARTVKLNSRALSAMKRQKAETLLGGDHVWLDPRYAQPWTDERAFRRSYWTPALLRLGIRYRRPYNMRHTYATMMLMAGMKSPFCAKQLGHSVDIFHTTYAKWVDGQQDDDEMGKLEQSISLSVPERSLGS